jgi:hypothetical protein
MIRGAGRLLRVASRSKSFRRELREWSVAAERITSRRALESLEGPHGLLVVDGPFRGMRYPDRRASGSSLLPKILGIYEHNLATILSSLAPPPSLVVDVGAAEGYYAIGFARLWARSHILAFDIDPDARQLLRRMALTNGVSDRVTSHAAADSEKLAIILSETKSALLLVDCEGCEYGLLSALDVRALQRTYIAIELHAHVPGWNGKLRTMITNLANTHECAFLPILPYEGDLKVPGAQDARESRNLASERRHYSFGWLIAIPRACPGWHLSLPLQPLGQATKPHPSH